MEPSFSTVTSSTTEVPWADFFNTYRFFAFNRGERKGFFYRLLHNETPKECATAHFIEKEPGIFVSAYKASYGGIDALENDAAVIEKFLRDIESSLSQSGAKRMEITLAPHIYHPERIALLQNILLRRNFSIEKQEINHFLQVDAVPLIEKMERNNAKRVRKCEREGCVFMQLSSEEEYSQVFEIIRANRERKGYPLTITLDHMLRSKRTFTEEWLFFGIELQGKLIAVSVCIRINPHTLYVLYWADTAEVHTLSPLAYLTQELYKLCQKEGIALLDIGVSTDNGIPNVGLTTFKEGLGCEASFKLSFVKSFEKDRNA